MRSSAYRWLVAGAMVLSAAVCTDGAAPPVERGPPKPWTGTITVHGGAINGFAISPDGLTLVTTGRPKVALWDLRTGRVLRERLVKEEEPAPRGAVFLRGGKDVACDVRYALHILDRRTLATTATHKRVGRNGLKTLVASPDGDCVAGASVETLAVWDAAEGKLLWHREFNKEGRYFNITALAFSPDGKVLAVGAPHGRDAVILLDPRTGRELKRIARHGEGPYRLVFAQDGRQLVGGSVGFLKVWDIRTGERAGFMKWDTKGKRRVVWAMALSPDGKTLAASCADDGVLLFEAATWGLRQAIDGVADHLGFCQDGRLAWAEEARGRVHVASWRGPAKPRRRTPDELRRLWTALGSDHAGAAFGAIQELLATPEQTVALLSRMPRIELTRKKLDRLVADLDDDDPEVREHATEELAKAGHLAESALRQGLAKGPSLEGRRRIGKLLKAVDPIAPPRLRFVRAVEVLEAIGSPAALKQLERLAGGSGGFELTDDAKAALARLRKSRK